LLLRGELVKNGLFDRGGHAMRMMIRVSIPVEAGNAAVKSGRMAQIIGEQMGRLKPEAAYFTTDGGQRTAYLFVDLKSQSEMPMVAEPFFGELNAKVEFLPVMNAEDLQSGLGKR